jgi:zinc D-Ala-D-Ala carboxypeptidase
MTAAPGIHKVAPRWTTVEAMRWPHFTAKELACKGSGQYYHDPAFLDGLERFRGFLGRSVIITSGHRSKSHNARVGGASRSMHLTIAVDVSLSDQDRVAMVRAAIKAGFTGIGFGATFLHMDMRPRPTVWPYSGSILPWARAFGFDPLARFTSRGLPGLL